MSFTHKKGALWTIQSHVSQPFCADHKIVAKVDLPFAVWFTFCCVHQYVLKTLFLSLMPLPLFCFVVRVIGSFDPTRTHVLHTNYKQPFVSFNAGNNFFKSHEIPRSNQLQKLIVSVQRKWQSCQLSYLSLYCFSATHVGNNGISCGPLVFILHAIKGMTPTCHLSSRSCLWCVAAQKDHVALFWIPINFYSILLWCTVSSYDLRWRWIKMKFYQFCKTNSMALVLSRSNIVCTNSPFSGSHFSVSNDLEIQHIATR